MIYVNVAILASAGALLLQGALAQSPAGPWQQCGGNNWTGATTCTSGYTCSKLNEWYHQCVPGSAPETSTTRTTLSSSTRPGTPTATSPPTPGDPNLPAIPSTLLPSHYFIRAVATPYYHSYLQAQPTRVPGKAYLEDPPGAGQFRLEGSQLVHNIGEGAAPLYLNVEKPADLTQRKLATEFKTTQNTFGTFAFQGDTLIWSTPEINRPNLAAWLICENKEVFINTGAFLYDTPAGCSDQTIHSYGGSTPDL